MSAASPLRVEDALSYLDNVKNQFADQPRVYNEFLDIMKEFKSQSTDTPGVIRRVTTLFQGHPDLIIGFNTFLPSGYEINQSDIEQSEAAYRLSRQRELQQQVAEQQQQAEQQTEQQQEQPTQEKDEPKAENPSPEDQAINPGASGITEASTSASSTVTSTPTATSGGGGGVAPGRQFEEAISLIKKIKTRYAHEPNSATFKEFLDVLNNFRNVQGAAQDPHQQDQVYAKVSRLLRDDQDLLEEFSNFLPEMKDQHLAASKIRAEKLAAQQQQQQATSTTTTQGQQSPGSTSSSTPPYNKQSPTVKSERPFTPVTAPPLPQVTSPPPQPSMTSSTATTTSQQASKTPPQSGGNSGGALIGDKRKNTSPSSSSGSSKKRALAGITVHDAAKYATARDLEFFERVKRHYKHNEIVFQNFLKCLNLYNQEIINRKELLEIVTPFIGKQPELLHELHRILGVEQVSQTPDGHVQTKIKVEHEASPKAKMTSPPQTSPRAAAAAAVPTAAAPNTSVNSQLNEMRPKIKSTTSSVVGEMNGVSMNPHEIDFTNQKRLGSSYRALPLEHQNQKCSSRDPHTATLLNDIWVSLPTWSEDSQFHSSKKNQYEDYVIRCEDERFELDIVIEANLDTVKVLEGVQKKLAKMKDEDRAKYKLEDTLGGSSSVIHRRAIHRIYGDKAADIIDGLKKSPAVTVPVVLKRLKAKDEEWKGVQKQFNRQWREQLQKYYLKSLDSQGMQFKQNDIKFVRWRTLLNEIESLFEERSTSQQINGNSAAPGPHLVIKHSDRSILKDANQLIMYAVKKQGNLNKNEKETAKDFLNKWIPAFYKIGDDGASDNTFNLMYTGNAHFLFFRLHGLLCERLTMIRDKSVEILTEHQNNENSELSEAPAAQLGMRNLLGVTPDEYYPAFIELVKCYTDGNVSCDVFEDTLREMFTTKAYVAYTMDKLLHSLVKLIFDIIQKDASVTIHQSYRHGRGACKGESIFKMQLISPAEINYRKKIEEKLIEDEFLFRVTVAKVRQISEVGIELCNIEDEDGESAKAEVEGHFKQELVQSPTPLFLKRNLLKIKLNSQNREKQFTNAPSAIGMVPLPGSRGKIKYTANKSETYHIPGCLGRAMVAYKDKEGYAIKKHKRFRSIVQKWVDVNAHNSKTAETLLQGQQPEKTKLTKQDCYFGVRNVYLAD